VILKRCMPRYPTPAETRRAAGLLSVLKLEDNLYSHILHPMEWNSRFGCYEIYLCSGIHVDYKIWIFQTTIVLISCCSSKLHEGERMVEMKVKDYCNGSDEFKMSPLLTVLVNTAKGLMLLK